MEGPLGSTGLSRAPRIFLFLKCARRRRFYLGLVRRRGPLEPRRARGDGGRVADRDRLHVRHVAPELAAHDLDGVRPDRGVDVHEFRVVDAVVSVVELGTV